MEFQKSLNNQTHVEFVTGTYIVSERVAPAEF